MRLLIRKNSGAHDARAAGRAELDLGGVLVRGANADEDAAPDEILAEAQGAFFAVAQKGRSFQRANPQARVVVDRGRYLIIDWAEPRPWTEEPGCFAVVPYADGVIDFGLRHGAVAERRPDIAVLVDSFTASDLERQVAALANIHTRQSTLPGFVQALDLCEPILAAAGCAVSRQPFNMPGGSSSNLIGWRRGTAAEPRLLVIGAHLDSVNHEDGDGARAPGADDNATGAVTVMQVATALAGAPELAHDVAFVLFGGEEQGLLGSRHFVRNLSPSDRTRLAGVVNIDMAGSKNTPNPSVLLEGAPLSQAVIDQLASAAATYTSLNTQVSLNPYASDHVPFIDAGIPAVLTIEGADEAYAHEHTSRDVVGRLDFELHRQITMMDLAWLATAAIPSQ